jgi:hypothetical protein
VNYPGREIETCLADIELGSPDEFSISFKPMAGSGYRSKDSRQEVNIRLDKDSQVLIKINVGHRTYWLVSREKNSRPG